MVQMLSASMRLSPCAAVRQRRGPALGRPCYLFREAPHPTGLRHAPPQLDFVRVYERAQGRRLRREPRWAARRDALYGQPARQALRQAAVMTHWGSVEEVWMDVLHYTGRARFIPAFVAFLSYV